MSDIMKCSKAEFAQYLIGAKILWAFTQKGYFDGDSEFAGEDITHYIIEKDGSATYWKEEGGSYVRALDFVNNVESMFAEQLEIAKSFNALLKVIEEIKNPKKRETDLMASILDEWKRGPTWKSDPFCVANSGPKVNFLAGAYPEILTHLKEKKEHLNE